ncbi:hypothetical protein Tco_0494254 [Tanacetum coccineum]
MNPDDFTLFSQWKMQQQQQNQNESQPRSSQQSFHLVDETEDDEEEEPVPKKIVCETALMSGENDKDFMERCHMLFKRTWKNDFKHSAAWNFLKDKHKWKNPDSTNARRNRLRVTEEDPEHFVPDALPRPDGMYRIQKSQRSSNSTASSSSNPGMFQEMLQQQYELERKMFLSGSLERESIYSNLKR